MELNGTEWNGAEWNGMIYTIFQDFTYSQIVFFTIDSSFVIFTVIEIGLKNIDTFLDSCPILNRYLP